MLSRPLSYISFLSILALAAADASHAQTPPPVMAPSVPAETAPQERMLLQHSVRLLTRSQFDEAARLLRSLAPPASVAVYVDWTPVPRSSRDAYRRAADQSLQAWNAALRSPQRFRWASGEESADLLVLFEKMVATPQDGQIRLSCSELRLEPANQPAGARRTARLRLSLCVPHSEALHSPESMGHLMGQGLGTYLGLGPSSNPDEVMGPDTHAEAVALRPAARELQLLKEVEQSRLRLLECAEKRIALHVSAPTLVVDQLELDAGQVARGDTARFVFTLRNTGDAPLQLQAKPNCNCVVPRLDSSLAPGASGKIEAEMHTSGLRGAVTRLIEVTSNDPDRPVVHLRLSAQVKSALEVLPTEAPLIGLKGTGPTSHELQIRITGKEPIEITQATCGAPYAAVRLEPIPPQPGGGRAYRLTLTIQPEAPEGRSSFLLTVTTNSQKEPNLSLNVTCDKGIVVTPPSIYLGVVRTSPSAPVTQIVTLQKRAASFRVQKVSCADSKLEVSHEPGKDGSEHRLKLTYRGGWAAGNVRTTVVVETDDTTRPRIEIPVLAAVQVSEAAR